MRTTLLFSVISLAAFAACANQPPADLDPTGGGAGGATGSGGATVSSSTGDLPTPGRSYFDTEIEPIFEGTCADCHANTIDDYGAPDFLGLNPSEYYDNLVARVDFVSCDTKNSILLNKGADPGHAGPPLTEGQHGKVEAWLAIEAAERFGGVCQGADPTTVSTTASTGSGEPPPPLTGEAAMNQFGECMTLQDWIDTGMPLVADATATYNNNQVPCHACHANGTGENWMPDPNGANATEDIAEAFENMRWMYASFNLIRWTVNNQDGSFKDIVPANRWRDKGQEGTNHPPYTLNATYQQYYDDWFELAYSKWVSGDCAETGAGGGGGAGGSP